MSSKATSDELPSIGIDDDRMQKIFLRIFVENEHEALVAVQMLRRHCKAVGISPQDINLVYGRDWRNGSILALRAMANKIEELNNQIAALKRASKKQKNMSTIKTKNLPSLELANEFKATCENVFGKRFYSAAARALNTTPRMIKAMCHRNKEIRREHMEVITSLLKLR